MMSGVRRRGRGGRARGLTDGDAPGKAGPSPSGWTAESREASNRPDPSRGSLKDRRRRGVGQPSASPPPPPGLELRDGASSGAQS